MSGPTGTHATRLSVFHLVAYVLPAVPLAALGLPVVVHLPQFYASRAMGLTLATTGAIFFMMRLLDLVIDPLAGYWSDRLQTRFGRRRPFVLAGTPILAIGIWMVFVPGGPVSVAHLCFWLFVMYLGWSMTLIPHSSWGAELSPEYHERSRVYGWSQVATILGYAGVLVAPAIIEHNPNATMALQVLAMAIFAVALLIPAVSLCVAVLPEPEIRLRTHAPLLPTLAFLLKDRAIRRVMAVDLIESTAQGGRGAMFFFFFQIALGLPKWAGTLLLVFFLSGVIFVPLWIALSRRIGKHRTLLACYVYGFLSGPLLLTVPNGNVALAFLVVTLGGVSYGAPAFLLRSMMADIADADTAATGAERAGLMYSFLSLTSKFGLGWSVGIAFTGLAWMGFDPKIVNPQGAIDHLRLFYVFFPLACAALNFLVMLGYPLDEARQRKYREDIAHRRALHISAEEIMPPGIQAGGPALASDSEAVAHVSGDANLSP
jgi:Na+/melibiose symporter-like transporter